ncbi:MAG: sulfurtransferase TusA family protein [Nitrososphaerales archaeon]|nr:sulfurtransferase TusA family protein [Nitrososphaerales archaeon]
MTSIQERAEKVLDTKGKLCPVPVIETSKAIKQIKVGQILEVVATDPGSKPDISAWARMTGNQLLGVDEEQGDPIVYKFLIKRLK